MLIFLKILTVSLPIIATILFRQKVDNIGYIVLLSVIICNVADIIIVNIRKIKFKNAEFWGAVKAFYHSCKFSETDDVRMMIYKTKDRRKVLLPIFPYYPEKKSIFDDENFGSCHYKGISFGKGIVGLAAECKEICIEKVNDPKELDSILRQYKFNEEEISQLRKDRQAYLALPIQFGKKRTKAVIYLDSQTKDTFTSEKIDHIMHMSKHIHSEYI